MKRYGATINLTLVAFLSVICVVIGCGDDEKSLQGPVKGPGVTSFMGLLDGRTLDYIQIDTSVTWVPAYTVNVDTSGRIIKISGSGSDWIVSDGNTPLINLKVSSPYTLMNGFWRKVGQFDALVTLPDPAVVMNSEMGIDEYWESTVPSFVSDTGRERFSFVYAYFGFHMRKTYSGTEELLSPAYAGTVYRYDVELLETAADSIPLARTVEYYAENIGMVRWEFRGSGFTRVLALRNYY